MTENHKKHAPFNHRTSVSVLNVIATKTKNCKETHYPESVGVVSPGHIGSVVCHCSLFCLMDQQGFPIWWTCSKLPFELFQTREASLQSGSLLSTAERILLGTSQENICWKQSVFIFSCLVRMNGCCVQLSLSLCTYRAELSLQLHRVQEIRNKQLIPAAQETHSNYTMSVVGV